MGFRQPAFRRRFSADRSLADLLTRRFACDLL
jgi:hypothetical protein